jgi:serine/threonine protein kinase
VIIDFGFAKYVPIPTKTFTLCGTPLYIAPEVILNRGHDHGADHWSFGILIYELLFGSNPFYKHGMDQMDLFRSIVKARYVTPTSPPISEEASNIMKGLLTRSSDKRLGSLADGEDGILLHPWFAKYDMDMKELRMKKYTAPVIPSIKNPLDASNFENWDHLDDKTKKIFPPISHEEQYLFENF